MRLISEEFFPEINRRIDALKKKMIQADADALLIGANTNIYYTSGRFFRGFVFISQKDNPIWFVIKPNVFDTSTNVLYIRKPEEIPMILNSLGIELPLKVGLEYDDLSFSEIIRLKKVFSESEFINGSIILKKTRMVKTDWEISQMKIDGEKQSSVYARIKKCYKPGMTDLSLQIEIERELRLEGSLGVSRVAGNLMEINMGSVISGDNADNPGPYEFTMGGSGVDDSLPVGANGKMILSGNTVMIDMNGAFNGYQTDMTRVWKLGEISDLALKAHECSIKILRSLEKEAVPGVPVKALYEKALEFVAADDLMPYFMGHKSQVSFIGHGVGIELNELPVLTAKSNDIIEKNMTIAIEPKFVIPHVGAVGVENTYRVTDNGLENLTVFSEEIQDFD